MSTDNKNNDIVLSALISLAGFAYLLISLLSFSFIFENRFSLFRASFLTICNCCIGIAVVIKSDIALILIKKWGPFLLAILVGLVFLASGLQKAFGVDLFILQIRDYEIISSPLLIILSAWGLIALECFLGTALILNFYPKLVAPVAGFIFLVFIAATGYAWATGVTDDCGCFGAWIERTPKQAMIEDLFLLAAVMVSWIWSRDYKKWPFYLKELIVGIALLSGLAIPVTAGPLLNRLSAAISGPVKEGTEPFVLENFEPRDLSTGKHLILIMATDCSHCIAEMESLDMIGEDKDLPETIAFVINSENHIEDFNFEFDPAFEIFKINDDDFWRLLGNGEIPRTLLIDEGIILKKWDFAPPEIDEIKAALAR